MGLTITKLSNGNIEITGNGTPYILLPTMHVFRDNSQIDGAFVVADEGKVKDVFRASNVDKLVLASGAEVLTPTTTELYDNLKTEFFFIAGGVPSGYKLSFGGAADGTYGYVAFTTRVVVSGDYSITFKCPSFDDGFIVCATNNSSAYIELHTSSIRVRISNTNYDISTTLPNTNEIEVRRTGSTLEIYNGGVLDGSVSAVINFMNLDFLGGRGTSANSFFVAGEIEYINISNEVIYPLNDGSGNPLDTSGNGNTGILSTYGTGLPLWGAL